MRLAIGFAEPRTTNRFVRRNDDELGQLRSGTARDDCVGRNEREKSRSDRCALPDAHRVALFHVGGDLRVDDLVRIGRRLAALELVDHVHAAHHLADYGVFAVEEGAVGEHDEELAVR